jgi:hypothetical protein
MNLLLIEVIVYPYVNTVTITVQQIKIINRLNVKLIISDVVKSFNFRDSVTVLNVFKLNPIVAPQ